MSKNPTAGLLPPSRMRGMSCIHLHITAQGGFLSSPEEWGPGLQEGGQDPCAGGCGQRESGKGVKWRI